MSARPSEPRRRLVAVIGDGAVREDHPKYALARELGHGLVDAGFGVITGGLGGVMEGASRGARESSAWRPGTIIALMPGHDPADANQYADIVVPTGLDHVRNALVAQADAVVAIGGGAGTLSELAFAWMYFRLLVGLRVEGWSGRLADQRVDERIRYPEISDDQVFGAADAAEAIAIVAERVDAYGRRHHGIRKRT